MVACRCLKDDFRTILPKKTHLCGQNQFVRTVKAPVKVVPKQAVRDEITRRPVSDQFGIPVVPNFVSKHLSKVIKMFRQSNDVLKELCVGNFLTNCACRTRVKTYTEPALTSRVRFDRISTVFFLRKL